MRGGYVRRIRMKKRVDRVTQQFKRRIAALTKERDALLRAKFYCTCGANECEFEPVSVINNWWENDATVDQYKIKKDRINDNK